MENEQKLFELLQGAPMDVLCDFYVKFRDEKSQLAEQIKRIDADMSEVEALLLTNLNKMGVESAATTMGTAYKSEKIYHKITDWGTYFNFVKANGDAFVQKRVGSAAVKEYKEQNGTLPPGLEEVSEI